MTGPGGGVWTIEIKDGVCSVREEFAEHADTRYTGDARDWCRVALGVMDDREAFDAGLLKKDGDPGSMGWYFYQIRHPEPPNGGETE